MREAVVFKTLVIRQQRMVIPEGREADYVIPVVAQLAAFVEFPGCDIGRKY